MPRRLLRFDDDKCSALNRHDLQPRKALEGVDRCDSNCQVVNNRRHRCPQGQRPHALRIERHDDGVPRLDVHAVPEMEPGTASSAYDAPICSHNVDSALIGTLSRTTTQLNVVVTRESLREQM